MCDSLFEKISAELPNLEKRFAEVLEKKHTAEELKKLIAQKEEEIKKEQNSELAQAAALCLEALK